jgi:DNA-binding transcriptional LysR family regulator
MPTDNIAPELLSRIKLRQLRLLIAVAEQGNILAAARQMGLTQPAVTKSLKDLEQDLGLELFKRSNRGAQPTIYGETLLRHARLVLAQLGYAGEELAELQSGSGGRVRVGTLLAASAYLLPAAIERLRISRPKVQVAIVQGTNDQLAAPLEDGELDFVVGRLPEFRHRKGLSQETLTDEAVWLVVRDGHPLLKSGSNLAFLELLNWDWILPPETTTLRRQIEKSFHDAEVEPPVPAIESVSYLSNRYLLIATDMIGVWPSQAVRDDMANGMLARLPLGLADAVGSVGVTKRREAALTPAAEALIQELRAVAADL